MLTWYVLWEDARELRIALQVLHRKLSDYRLDPERRAVAFGGMKGLASLPLVKA